MVVVNRLGLAVGDVAADVDRDADEASLDPAAPVGLAAAVGGPANDRVELARA